MKTSISKQNIPKEWKSAELSGIADITMGQSPASSSYNQSGEGMPFFQGKADFTDSYRVIVRYWTTVPTKLSESGDILLSVRAPVGDVAISDTKACIGRGLASVRAKKDLSDQDFLFQLLFSLKDALNTKAQGSTFTAINGPALRKILVALPPLTEQKKIAVILGAIDKELQKTDEVITVTEKLRHELIQKLFTRGIGHTKFKKTKIGEVPENWNIVAIKDTTIELIDGDRGTNYPKLSEFSSGGYCLFLNNKNIKEDRFVFSDIQFISREKDESLRKGKLRRYDVVLTTRGTVGNVAHYDESVSFENIRINSGMLILRATGDLNPLYVYHLMKSPLLKKRYIEVTSGSAQPQLPIRSLEQVYVPIPPEDEQEHIAEVSKSLDEKISINKKLRANLILLKRGLMQDLLSGKVRTTKTNI